MTIEGKQIKEWVERAYSNAVKHGWHEEKKPIEHWIMMISTEVTEAVQANRKGRYMNVLDKSGLITLSLTTLHGGLLKKFYAKYIEGTVESELADICIRLFDLMGLKNVKCRTEYTTEEETVELCKTRDFTVNAFFISRAILNFATPNNSLLYEAYFYEAYFNDIIVATFEWAESLGIDLVQHINLKMRYNETREYHHGGKKY